MLGRTMPRVSVLMPVRNGGPLLDEACKDLARQTYADLEIQVVDDGSTDDTPERLARFVAEAPSRRRVLHQDPAGLVAALNAGLAQVQGEIVVRLDADDRCHPDRIRRQVDLLDARPDLAGCGTQIQIIPRSAVTEGMARYERWQNSLMTPEAIHRDLLVEAPLCHPSVALRRDALSQVDGYRDGPFPEDYDLWLRLDAAGFRLGKVPGLLTLWREGPGRATRTDSRYSPEAFRRAKLDYLCREGGPLSGGAAVVWGAGQEGKPWLRDLAERGVRVDRVVELAPGKLGQRIHGALAIPPDDLPPPADTPPLIVAVGAPGARAEIRVWLEAHGFTERVDFWCVA